MGPLFRLIRNIILLVLLYGFVTLGLDYWRMSNGKVPIFNKEEYNMPKKEQRYQGLFYQAKRTIRASRLEDLRDSSNIRFYLFHYFKLDLPKVENEENYLYTIETKEIENCQIPSKLYYANNNKRIYTYCLEEINIKKERTDSLFNFLEEDVSLIDDIENDLAFLGLYQDNSTSVFQSREDQFTNNGLILYHCDRENVKDIYIAPKNTPFQPDFCTYKNDTLEPNTKEINS